MNRDPGLSYWAGAGGGSLSRKAGHAYAVRLRELNKIPDSTYATFRKGIENPDPAVAANVIIGLIRVASFLLERQLRYLEKTFVKEGGLRERMTRARLEERRRA